MKVTYNISKKNAERMIGKENMALISITDYDDYYTNAQGNWGSIDRYYFIDGEYNQEDIDRFGLGFYMSHNGYMSPEDSIIINKRIKEILLDENIVEIVVNCHAGKARSAAVSLHISEISDFKYTGDSYLKNDLVYNLMKDPYIFDFSSTEKKEKEPKLNILDSFIYFFKKYLE